MAYNHDVIERKWQHYWNEHKTFKVTEDNTKDKYYVMDMFPYPSGQGLHVGHPEGYTATDIMARMKRMQGKNVLHPMGWDAFGLPAEQYALKTGIIHVILRLKISRFSKSKSNRLAFHMTGTEKLIPPIHRITNGPSGSLSNYINMDWPMKITLKLIGRPILWVEPLLPTKKLLMGKLNVVVTQFIGSQCVNGF